VKDIKELTKKSQKMNEMNKHFQDEVHYLQKCNALLSIILFPIIFAVTYLYFEYLYPEFINFYFGLKIAIDAE
jgi:hypothetical protein